MADSNENDTLSFFGGLILGFIVSVPVVAWLSPRSGVETRHALSHSGIIIRRKVADSIRKPVEQIQQQIQQVRSESVEDALAEGKALASQRQRADRHPDHG